MHFLTYTEIGQLQHILIHRTILKTADADTRSNLLGSCGLSDICGVIPLNIPAAQFVINLCPKLSEVHITVESSRRLGLVVFLEYLSMIDPHLSEDEKIFFKHVVTKWEQSQASTTPGTARRGQISSLLAQARQEQPLPSTGQKRVKIDKGIIVNYNLDEQMTRFRQTLGYEGAFTFAVGGNHNILERYIIERIKRELKAKTERPNQSYQIRLYRTSVSGSASIERELVTACGFERLTDLFDIQSNTDIVLIIWNYDLPAQQMKNIAQAFWQEIEPQVWPFLQNQGRCLVIVWADVDRAPLEAFTRLPTPDKFELSELIPWFRGKLKQLELEEELVEHCLDRLKKQDGHVIGTYQEMNQIIHELQGGVTTL